MKILVILLCLSCVYAPATATAQTSARPRLVVQLSQGEIDSSTFSRDGKLVATGSWQDGSAVVWETATGREIRRLAGNTEPSGAQDGLTALAFSPDTRQLAVSVNNVIRIWDLLTGKVVRMLRRPAEDGPLALAFSPDGRRLVSDASRARVTLDVATGRVLSRTPLDYERWKTPSVSTPDGRLTLQILRPQEGDVLVFRDASGKELRREPSQGDRALSVSPDGRLAVFGTYDETSLWDLESFTAIRPFGRFAGTGESTRFTADGLFTASAGGSRVWLRDVAGGSRVEIDTGETEPRIVAFSPDHRLVAYDVEADVAMADAATGKIVRTFAGPPSETPNVMTFSSTSRFLAVNCGDFAARIYDPTTGREVASLPGESSVDPPVAFTADDRLAFFNWTVWDTATWTKVVELPIGEGPGFNYLPSAAFSPDGKFILTGRAGQLGYVPQLWDLQGKRVRQFPGYRVDVDAIAFSPDGKRVLLGSRDATARVWDTATGRELFRLAGHTDPVREVAFSPDGRFAITQTADSIVRLCDASDGRELCRLVTTASGDWVAVDSEGRFDTNALDGVEGLHWIGPDAPLKPLPVEVFMREYFEPRLVERILAGERFAPVRSVAELNPVQPSVSISSFAKGPAGTVTVNVEVAKASGERLRAGRPVPIQTGVYDVRLFRDGQLVGYAPAEGGEVRLDASGKATLTFENVKLPTGAKQAEFSAYAFNVDRVKSETSRATYTVESPTLPVRGRAYVVSVGVNDYDDPKLALRYAANDARRIESLLTERLNAMGAYDEVVPVRLISDETTRAATKANVKAVLDLLSGRTPEPGALAGVANADRLLAAGPDDLVVITFSGHGYAAADGTFYLVPSDVGESAAAGVGPASAAGGKLLAHTVAAPAGLAAILPRCVSNDELALWLRDLDAGEIALVVDACQSAASIQTEGFKPGPMGSRGLGQLAYDKGMRVLAATQTDNVALENAKLEQGLLTYALTHDGIEKRQADFKPVDQAIGLSEWLSYGVKRVPELYREVRTGKLTTFGGEQPRILVHGAPPEKSPARKTQQPALFDFSRRRDVTVAQ